MYIHLHTHTHTRLHDSGSGQFVEAETASVTLSSIFPSSHVPQMKPTKMIILQTLNPLSLCNGACREEEKNFCAFLPLVKILQGVISSLNEKFCIR